MNIKENIIFRLFDIEAIKFGDFTLKSGVNSPIYIDLRLIPSYPILLKGIAEALWDKIKTLSYDILCGVPYTAIPFATSISILQNIPMLMIRKEIKEHGTKKKVEGSFKPSERCLIIEDLVTSGMSIIETSNALRNEGLIINDAVVLIDRLQGGKENLMNKNIALHSVMTIEEVLTTLMQVNKISQFQCKNVMNFLSHQERRILV